MSQANSSDGQLRRSLKPRHLAMIAIGGSIGFENWLIGVALYVMIWFPYQYSTQTRLVRYEEMTFPD